jgi:O-antigen/teichoic acid export membrane protein
LNKKRLLLENVIVYGFSNVISKIVPFLFLPIVLFLIDSPSDYAIYTTFITIIGLGSPLVTFGMYDAVFREYFEVEEIDYKKKVLSTSFRFIIFSSLVVSMIFLLGADYISYFFGVDDISIIYLALLSIVINGFITILSLPTRLKNDRKTFVVLTTIIPIILYGVSLLTLLIGLSYYGLIISTIASNFFTLAVYSIINNHYFSLVFFSKEILKKLLRIAFPLVPLFIIYWLYNSMDRIMIVQYLGLDDLGIYSVAAKFGSISSILYISFAGGFQHFSFSTMKESNQVENNTKLLNLILFLSSFSLVFLIFFIDYFFNIIFPLEYFDASTSSLFLFISPLLLLSFQIVGNQFIIVRKSNLLLLSLVIGLVANLVFNTYLIPLYGILGASFSTFLGYFINLIIAIIYATFKNLIKLTIKLSFNLCVIMSLSITVFIINIDLIKFFLTFLLLIISFLINIEMINTIINYLKSFLKIKPKTI